MSYRFVSLITDFGTIDESVGVVKSVILATAPETTFIDISHEVPPHDVRSASLMLARAAKYMVPGVVMASVDVSNRSRYVAIELGDGESVLVGPDNGIFAPVVSLVGALGKVVELPKNEDSLFPARDLLAVVAGKLCVGAQLTKLGKEIDATTLVPLMLPFSELRDGVLEADVLHVDRYGNAHLNVVAQQLTEIAEIGQQVKISPIDIKARVVTRFADLKERETGLLVQPEGGVLLVVNEDSASSDFKLSLEGNFQIRAL